MKKVVSLLMVLGFAFALPTSQAKEPPPVSVAQPAQDESNLREHNHYVNKDGQVVHSPAHTKNGKAPSGASAQCRDGSYSFSQNHRGTCSHHGGVAVWLSP